MTQKTDSQTDSQTYSMRTEAQTLLPAGLSDLLDPQATQDADAAQAVMQLFAHFGYQRVKPPLVEFEETLLGQGPGVALANQSFRVMDPMSHKMMALRADMTAQMARISGSRLAHLPRPLRLAYVGEVMRVVPDALNPERQMVQAGAELIGRDDSAAVIEVLGLAVLALRKAGITDLTVDLNSPRLLDSLLKDADDAARDALMLAVRERNAADLDKLGSTGALLAKLMAASGDNPDGLKALVSICPPETASLLQMLLDAANGFKEAFGDVKITLDPLETRHFDYHTGLGFSIFGAGLRGEIARGGAYITGFGEVATGLSVYMERVLKALPERLRPPMIYLPVDAGLRAGLAYQARGRHVILGQYPAGSAEAEAEATRLGCLYILRDLAGQPEELA